MKEINLREFYPEIYKTDLFISLPDEVVDVLVEYQRKEVAYRRRTYRHKAYLSLDYGDDIEREAVLFTPTLQEIVERHLEEERVYRLFLRCRKNSASVCTLTIFSALH